LKGIFGKVLGAEHRKTGHRSFIRKQVTELMGLKKER
jgi:hypothetical protein